jgi:hypothetical protein
MRKGFMVLVLAVLLGIGIGGYALAHYWGHGYAGGWGQMGPWGHGYKMAPAYGGCCCGGPLTSERSAVITEEDAVGIARNYIGVNPNLKVGKVEDRNTHFEAEILTKDDSLVTMLDIDKSTGAVRPRY